MFITSLSSLSKVRRLQTVSTGHITTWHGISSHAQGFAKGYIVCAMTEYPINFSIGFYLCNSHTGKLNLDGYTFFAIRFVLQLEDEASEFFKKFLV